MAAMEEGAAVVSVVDHNLAKVTSSIVLMIINITHGCSLFYTNSSCAGAMVDST